MKKLFLLLLLTPLVTTAQSFTLSDSIFSTGSTFTTYKILFDLDKATLRPESKMYLDTIADFLLSHPNLKMEVGNHTDLRTSPYSSQRLSSKRARTIVDYLVQKGVDQGQLVATGYENHNPLVSKKEIDKCKTKDEMEKQHSLNRRTEFKILATDYAK